MSVFFRDIPFIQRADQFQVRQYPFLDFIGSLVGKGDGKDISVPDRLFKYDGEVVEHQGVGLARARG